MDRLSNFFWTGPFFKMDRCPKKWAGDSFSPQKSNWDNSKLHWIWKMESCPFWKMDRSKKNWMTFPFFGLVHFWHERSHSLRNLDMQIGMEKSCDLMIRTKKWITASHFALQHSLLLFIFCLLLDVEKHSIIILGYERLADRSLLAEFQDFHTNMQRQRKPLETFSQFLETFHVSWPMPIKIVKWWDLHFIWGGDAFPFIIRNLIALLLRKLLWQKTPTHL